MKKILILFIALYLFSFKLPTSYSTYACSGNGVVCKNDSDCCSNACVETKVTGTGKGAVNVTTYYCGTAEEKATGKTIKLDNEYGIPTEDEDKSDIKGPCEQKTDQSGVYFICQTGLGMSISTRPKDFVSAFFGVILSISGMIALLLIIFSGYRLVASRGNPEKITEAKDRLASAIIGLLFILFSLVILQIIGVDILHIPGIS